MTKVIYLFAITCVIAACIVISIIAGIPKGLLAGILAAIVIFSAARAKRIFFPAKERPSDKAEEEKLKFLKDLFGRVDHYDPLPIRNHYIKEYIEQITNFVEELIGFLEEDRESRFHLSEELKKKIVEKLSKFNRFMENLKNKKEVKPLLDKSYNHIEKQLEKTKDKEEAERLKKDLEFIRNLDEKIRAKWKETKESIKSLIVKSYKNIG